LMHEGICMRVALGCQRLRQSPRVQGVCGDGQTERDTHIDEAQALVDIIRDETESPTLAGVLSPGSLRLLFPDGEAEDSITNRRQMIIDAEHISDSTLSRREFTVCIALLAALGLSTGGHAKVDARDPRLDGLEGEWFALWETTVHGASNLNMEKVRISLTGDFLEIRNDAPSPHNPEGYLWRGTLQAVQDRMLVGTYSAVDPGAGWSGTLYYQVGGSGAFLEGRWVGANVDSAMNSGFSVLARTQEVARRRFAFLVGGSAEIPRMD
jgi:hypothetical protein